MTPSAWPGGRQRAGASRSRAGSGFTLLEMLVAMVLVAVVAVAAARALAASRRSDASGQRTAETYLTLDLGSDLLLAAVRRAGFVPYPPGPGIAGAAWPWALRLVIHTARPEGDEVSVRYLDDRLAGAPALRDVRFESGRDGRGAPQLYRITASGAKQPLVQGVTRLTVAAWVDAAGLHDRSALSAGAMEPWLVLLRVAADGTGPGRIVAVPLPNRPATEVEVVP